MKLISKILFKFLGKKKEKSSYRLSQQEESVQKSVLPGLGLS